MDNFCPKATPVAEQGYPGGKDPYCSYRHCVCLWDDSCEVQRVLENVRDAIQQVFDDTRRVRGVESADDLEVSFDSEKAAADVVRKMWDLFMCDISDGKLNVSYGRNIGAGYAKEWRNWATAHPISPDISAFLGFKPALPKTSWWRRLLRTNRRQGGK